MSIHAVPPPPATVDEFRAMVARFQSTDHFRQPLLWAVGGQMITGQHGPGILASVHYPHVNGPGENLGAAAILMEILGIEPIGVQTVHLDHVTINRLLEYFAPFMVDRDAIKNHGNIVVLLKARAIDRRIRRTPIVVTFIFDDIPIQGVEDGTLKLYGLSTRKFKPRELNLDGLFSKLPNVVWHNGQPMDADEVHDALLDAAFGLSSYHPSLGDRIPPYLDRINPLVMGVRIVNPHSVRLGAHLADGTVIMTAGAVNFNAGTLGKVIIEGRVSSGGIVGPGSDIGGGASILGILSGGNNTPITIGRNCLLEALCVCGIPIADAVIIAAGVAVTKGLPVFVNLPEHPLHGQVVKAIQLTDTPAITFRPSHSNGATVEVVRTTRNIDHARKLADGEDILNVALHSNRTAA